MGSWATGAVVRAAARRNLGTVAIVIPESLALDAAEVGEAAAEGSLMATFDPSPYRSKRENLPDAVRSVTLIAGSSIAKALTEGIKRGLVLGEAANLAREPSERSPSRKSTVSR